MAHHRFFLCYFVFFIQLLSQNEFMSICPLDVPPCQRTFLQTYATVADSTPFFAPWRLPMVQHRHLIAPETDRIGGSKTGFVTVRWYQEGIATA